MASAAGIDTWNDGHQPITALIVGQLMATQAKTGVIVFAAGICLPEIEHYLRHRNAARRHHQAGKNQVAPFDTWFEQGTAFWRVRLKVRALCFLIGVGWSEGQVGVASASGWCWDTKNNGSANATRQKKRLLISSLIA
jgi:hypothetical protein